MSSIKRNKRTLVAGYMLLLVGGAIFLVIATNTGDAKLSAAVAWGAGSGAAIYSSARAVISQLESSDPE